MENRPNTEKAKFEAVFYGTEAPLVIFMGPDMVYEMLNSTYQAIYPGRQLLGKPLLEAVPELVHSPFPAILRRVYDSGQHFTSHEGVVYLKNKITGKTEERYFDTTFSRICYGDGEPFRILATPKEVTEKVLARKRLEKGLRELEAEKDLREKFVSALTHDLRTPLAVIKISAQILRTKLNDPDEKCIHRITSNVDRADRMIRDLLDANRLKANEGLQLFIQQTSIDELLQYAIQDLEDLYGKRFAIHNMAGNLNVFWDPMAVHRIIDNLASNAIKYGAEDATVTIGIATTQNFLEISVHNTGNPISPEDQKHLFNAYHRTEFAKASKQKGWGIGLSLVQGLAMAHKGFVAVESSLVHGTTFTVRLPTDARK